jgi:hypothetical protein
VLSVLLLLAIVFSVLLLAIVLSVLLLLAIVLSVLRFTDSYYPFGISKFNTTYSNEKDKRTIQCTSAIGVRIIVWCLAPSSTIFQLYRGGGVPEEKHQPAAASH